MKHVVRFDDPAARQPFGQTGQIKTGEETRVNGLALKERLDDRDVIFREAAFNMQGVSVGPRARLLRRRDEAYTQLAADPRESLIARAHQRSAAQRFVPV